jgi:hypothetical protein
MADQLSFPGWKNTATGNARFPNVISCNVTGTKLTYTFKGTAVGMDWMPGPDGGEMQWSVDNSTPIQKSGYSTTTRDSYPCLTNKLSHGSHSFTIEVLSTKNAASTGNYIRMGALFLNQDLSTSLANPEVQQDVRGGFLVREARQSPRAASVAFDVQTIVRDYYSISIIGVSGRTCTCLFAGELGTGYHRIEVPNAKIGPGAYVLRVKSAGHGAVLQKLVVSK